MQLRPFMFAKTYSKYNLTALIRFIKSIYSTQIKRYTAVEVLVNAFNESENSTLKRKRELLCHEQDEQRALKRKPSSNE